MNTDTSFICNLCLFFTNDFFSFKTHYVRKHQHDPRFFVACCIDNCNYSTKVWGNFRVHMHRNHKEYITENHNHNYLEIKRYTGNDDNMQNNHNQDEIDQYFHGNEDIQFDEDFDPLKFNAQFTLALETKHNLSQSAINSVISSSELLIHNHMVNYRRQIECRLSEMGLPTNILLDISFDSHLEEFRTHSKRKSYYNHHLETLIEPVEVKLGTKFVTSKSGVVTQIARLGYFIPFEQTLANLLSLPEIWHYVQNPHFSNDEFLYDICDGFALRYNSFFSAKSNALQIIINCDDMEIVNPLGSHIKKHKVTMFYFTIANIPPAFRSRLTAIQLLAVARTLDCRENGAAEALLTDFICCINRLCGEGISLNINGNPQTIYGNLVLVSADTLAANWIGQFKEGVGFALRNCRRCEIESSLMKTKVVERELTLRGEKEHRDRCQFLSSLSPQARTYWSKVWGINGSSCLLKLHDFNIISGLIFDPMHILLEGVVPHELAQILYNLIYVKKFFTLKWLNSVIKSYEYSYLHKHSKPEPIDKAHLDGKLKIKQTASAMITLIETLPILVGKKVRQNDANWHNTLRLIQIVLFSLSPYCSRDTSFYLQTLIAEYLHNFQQLYPRASFIPKMHYMLHLPQQMMAYGPLRHQWCMRFEGKNGYFAGKKYKNFRNLPLTMAKKHQLYMAFMQTAQDGRRSNSFLYEGDELSTGSEIMFSVLYPDLVDKLQEEFSFPIDKVFFCQSASIHGIEYKKGCALVHYYNAHEEPVFVILLGIISVGHVKFFLVETTASEYYLHILSYIISKSGKYDIFRYNSLRFKWPLSVYTYDGNLCIMNKNSHTYAYPF